MEEFKPGLACSAGPGTTGPPAQPQPSPDDRVCAHDELGLGVPLVVRDVVVGLQPNPLLAFGQKPVATGLPFAKLHHCWQKTEAAGSKRGYENALPQKVLLKT